MRFHKVKNMKRLIKSPIFYNPIKLLKIVVNRFNHNFARENLRDNPQLVIFSFDHIGLTINLDGRYENKILSLIEQFIKEEMHDAKNHAAIDIGANIGNHSIFLSNYFKIVYAFEPHPLTYELLAINARTHAYKKNILTFNFGLSDAVGEVPFFTNKFNFGSSKIEDSYGNKTSSDFIKIKVDRGDNIQSLNNEKISLIKIDIEGHELNALQGLEKLIKLNKPAILFEQGNEVFDDGTSQVIDYLTSLDYKFFTIKQRFYLGENAVAKLLRHLFAAFLGDQLTLVETKYFEKHDYEMILGIPK